MVSPSHPFCAKYSGDMRVLRLVQIPQHYVAELHQMYLALHVLDVFLCEELSLRC